MAKVSEEFDKDGLLWKRIGSSATKKRRFGQKKWNLVYVNLIAGSFHFYKEEEDQEPKGSITLNEFKFYDNATEKDSSKKFCFALRNDKSDYLFACDEEAEFKEWVKAIEGNMKKGPAPPLKKEKRLNRVKELAFKTKKNVLGKAATSTLGKKAIRAQAPDEVKDLITSVKRIVERESKSSKKASEIEENIFKIGVKSYFLIDGNKLSIDDLLVADKPVRRALEILSKCHDHAKYSRNPNPKLLHEKFIEVQKLLNEGGDILTKVLTPHLKPKNVALIKETLEYLGDPDRLLRIFQDESLDDDLQELINAGDHYTQFHFYSDKN